MCQLTQEFKLATWKGLEPSAFRVTGGCSNQLSYQAIKFVSVRLLYPFEPQTELLPCPSIFASRSDLLLPDCVSQVAHVKQALRSITILPCLYGSDNRPLSLRPKCNAGYSKTTYGGPSVSRTQHQRIMSPLL